jgi:tryptophan synthase
MDHIKQTFAKCKEQKRAALVAYITAGYPTVEEAVDIMLGLENGGAGTVIPILVAPEQFTDGTEI